MPVRWCDDCVCLSFARCRRPSRMPLRCGPVGGCAKSYQNIPAQLSIVLSFTGGTVCLYGDLVVLLALRIQCCGERRSQQLGLLCGVACAAPVVRALVTLPLQAWSLLRSSSHLSWAIVPYSGATIFLRRYCTSQPQFASRELQIVRDPTRRNIACSSHSRVVVS